jgi:integrase
LPFLREGGLLHFEALGLLLDSRRSDLRVTRLPSLAERLAAHLAARVASEPDAPVFRAPQGGNLRYGAFYHRRWLPALSALDLPQAGVHVLRHSAAARMVQAGPSPKAVQAIVGHRSAGFTLSVYGHLFDADLDDLAARLDSCSQTVPTRLVTLEPGVR